MSTEDLIELANKHGIQIIYFHIAGEALALDLDGEFYIALNPSLKDPELKEALAHELGHCFTRGFYSILTPYATRERLEASADHWAYKALLPPETVKALTDRGITYYCDIAYEMSLSERFTRDAIAYYDSCSLI